jgi:hypothetical protein
MSRYRVLAVDDCDDDLFLLKRALDRSPHLSLDATARDGEQGIDYLERAGEEVVARDGIEPPTQGFSVLCSTN